MENEIIKFNNKKNFRNVLILFVLMIVVWISCDYYSDEMKTRKTVEENKRTEEINSHIHSDVTSNDDVKVSIEVWSLGSPPFKNHQSITFHETSLKELEKLKKPSIIIANKEFLKEENKNQFMELAKQKHTILFYDEELNAEEVVAYFDGIIPVVPIDSSIPLKFQAYGITTLNDRFIPIFVSVTSDQKELNMKSFDQLFNQVVKKTKKAA